MEHSPDDFAHTKSAPVNGLSLAYRESGGGEPVVFVHGTLSDLRSWDEQLPVIAGKYRAIAYSRRFSPPNPDIERGRDDPMQQHVDDLVRFQESVGASPAHLVGSSWGAFVALLVAIQHPQRVTSLVLQEPPVLSLFTSTPPRLSEIVPLLLRRPRTALAILRFGASVVAPTQRALRRGDDKAAVEKFTRGALGGHAYEQLTEKRRQQALDNAGTLRAQQLGAGFPPLNDDQVASVAVPTLLMTGAETHPFFRNLTDRLEELLPNASRIEIPDATHAMSEQQPAAVNEAILEFLAEPVSKRRG